MSRKARFQEVRPSFREQAMFWGGLILFVTAFALAIIFYEPKPKNDVQRFLSAVPGVDFAGLAPAQRAAFLEEVNRKNCTCGCKLTLAHCRNHHGTCQTSMKLCREIVASFKQQDQPRKE